MNDVEERLAKALKNIGVPSEQADIYARKAPQDVKDEMAKLSDDEAIKYARNQAVNDRRRKAKKEITALSLEDLEKSFHACYGSVIGNKDFERAANQVVYDLNKKDGQPTAIALASTISVLLAALSDLVGDDSPALAMMLVGSFIHSRISNKALRSAVDCFED